jgi:hypothetical protein
MLLAVTPPMPVKLDGKPQAAPRLEFKKDAGSITIGEDGADLKITIAYKIAAGALSAEISTEPWSILSVGDAPRGKTPQTIELDGMTNVGFKRPGVASLPSLRLKYTP